MWLMLLKLLPMIFQLVGIAEKAFDGVPDSGAEKKSLVTAAAKAVVGGVGAISTGGQAETFDRIAPTVSVMIDSAASIMFPNKKQSMEEHQENG